MSYLSIAGAWLESMLVNHSASYDPRMGVDGWVMETAKDEVPRSNCVNLMEVITRDFTAEIEITLDMEGRNPYPVESNSNPPVDFTETRSWVPKQVTRLRISHTYSCTSVRRHSPGCSRYYWLLMELTSEQGDRLV